MSNELLDRAIDEATENRQLKMAMVITRVSKRTGIDYQQIAERIYHLSRAGKFETFGDITNWRFSEIRRVDGFGTVIAMPSPPRKP